MSADQAWQEINGTSYKQEPSIPYIHTDDKIVDTAMQAKNSFGPRF